MYGGGKNFLSGGGAGIPFPHTPFPARPAGAKRLGIFHKIGSRPVVKIHQNLTFCNSTNFFGGRAKRVPSISPRQFLCARRGEPRLAPAQTEVRLPRNLEILSRICFAQLLINQNI